MLDGLGTADHLRTHQLVILDAGDFRERAQPLGDEIVKTVGRDEHPLAGGGRLGGENIPWLEQQGRAAAERAAGAGERGAGKG